MDEIFMITTTDGRVFQARRVLAGSRAEPRWQLVDEDGRVFVGPTCLAGPNDPMAIRELVEDWWQMRVSLGYGNATVASLWAKIWSQDN